MVSAIFAGMRTRKREACESVGVKMATGLENVLSYPSSSSYDAWGPWLLRLPLNRRKTSQPSQLSFQSSSPFSSYSNQRGITVGEIRQWDYNSLGAKVPSYRPTTDPICPAFETFFCPPSAIRLSLHVALHHVKIITNPTRGAPMFFNFRSL